MGSIKVAYSELFSVSLKQPFYENGISGKYKVSPVPDYKIMPTPKCQTVLNRLDMIMKINLAKGGFTVWCRTNGMSGANDLLYFKPRTGDQLTFIIALNNPYFLNYNDLPSQPANDQIYYFNNQINDAVVPRDNLHLSLDVVGVALPDTIKKVTGSYNYVHGANVAVGTAKLKHLTIGIEISPKSHLNEGGQAFLAFDLSGFPAGKCEILIGGASAEIAYHINEMGKLPVFAIVECSLDVLPLPNYRIIENDGSITPLRPRYILLFNNRPTLWNYKILLEDNSPLFVEIDAMSVADKADFFNSLNIVSNDTAVVFNLNVVTDQHFEFISNTRLLLREKYFSSSSTTNEPLTLTLKKHIGNPRDESDVKINLPYPPAHQLDASGDPVIYSKVLLNL